MVEKLKQEIEEMEKKISTYASSYKMNIFEYSDSILITRILSKAKTKTKLKIEKIAFLNQQGHQVEP